MKLKNVAVAVVALALAAGMTACGGSASSTAASSASEAVSSSVAASSEAASSEVETESGFPVQRLFPVQWFLSDSSKARIWARSAAKWIPACRWAEESPLQIISFSKAFRLS